MPERKVEMDHVSVRMLLKEIPDEYTFSIERRQHPPILHIPGDHRGPDLCFPQKPEQEDWLNGLPQFMTPYWYCQWKFNDDKSCDDFLQYLDEVKLEEV
jgi:hypothetical protein